VLVGDARAVGEVDGPIAVVQADRRDAEPQLHRLLLIPTSRAEWQRSLDAGVEQ
jgi:hypothetical protein